MRRRQFIAGLGSAAAWPVVARAQQPAVPVVGYLDLGPPEMRKGLVAVFRKGLSETGYVEGRNLAIEYRAANSDFSRLPELAADLVRRRVAIIVAPGGDAAARAVFDLAVGEDAAREALAVTFDGVGDPIDVGGIDPEADDA